MERGDLVLVLPHLQGGSRYSGVYMNPDMTKYRGKVYMIESSSNETRTRFTLMDYNEKEFPHMHSGWVWARCMIAPFKREQVKRTSLD